MGENEPSRLHRLATPFVEIFGLSRGLALISLLLFFSVVLFGVYWFIHSAPPETVYITSGGEGSSFATNAEKYAEIFARHGVKLKILPSNGSRDNLKRLNDPTVRVDVGFVQGGVTNKPDSNTLVSLGSINYEPLLVFYRSESPVPLLSGFAGKRLAIGPHGSGTRSLAAQLLALNGIKTNGPTQLLDLDGDAAARALLAGTVDVVFLMGDTTSIDVMRQLEHTEGLQLFDFTQADGYTRRISYLNKLVFPQGSIDFGKNLPAHDVNLVGPTVELIARPKLHPAIIDLFIGAARETNSAPGLFKRRNEFPAPIEHDFPISAEAARYYKSGEGLAYRLFPYWIASRVNSILVALLPMVVLLIPAMRILPAAYRWQMQMRIKRWYRELLAAERSLSGEMTPGKREHLMSQLTEIEQTVNKMKVPASFADQFYNLRGHIIFVRQGIERAAAAKK
jgi:TRAP-type uncharacterized transport system substrate-binding protein